MFARKIIGIGSLAILLSSPASAVAPELSLQQIIDRNIAARGGAPAWRAVNTLAMSGTMDAGFKLPDPTKMAEDLHHPAAPRKRFRPELTKPVADAEAPQMITLPFLMDFRRPRMTRVEIKFKDQTALQVYDGTNGWKVRPYIGRHQVEPFSAEELRIATEQLALDGPLVDYAAKGIIVDKMGAEQVDGRDAYKLRLTLKGGQVRNLWIDAQTFLDAKIDSSRLHGNRQQNIATLMSDYRNVQGLQIPFHLENRVEGVKIPQRLMIEQVSVNPPLKDSLFAKPQ